MACYSGVNGACCPRPAGLLGSSRGVPVSVRSHWPERSGYLSSSKARAPANEKQSVAASTSEPIDRRYGITLLPGSLLRSIEVPQVRRRLVLLGGHQEPVGTEKIDVLVDADVNIAFGAETLVKPDWFIAHDAPKGPIDHPWPGQRMVDRGDVVVQQIRIGLVEIDALLDNGLVVSVQRDAGGVEGAGTLHGVGLDHERVVAAFAIVIEPSGDRIAQELRIVLHVGREAASIRVDAAKEVVVTLRQNVGDFRSDNDFPRRIADHEAWHARRNAGIGRVDALAALHHVARVLTLVALTLRPPPRHLP